MKINPALLTFIVGLVILFSSALFRNYPLEFIALPALVGMLVIFASPVVGYLHARKKIKKEYENKVINRTAPKNTTGSIMTMIGIIIIAAPIGLSTLSFAASQLLNCSSVCSIGGESVAEILQGGFMFGWFSVMAFIPGIILIVFGNFLHRFLTRDTK